VNPPKDHLENDIRLKSEGPLFLGYTVQQSNKTNNNRAHKMMLEKNV